MHKNIQKIIAVLNDFSMIDDVLAKTFSFSAKYNAVVEILYVHENPFFDIPDFFRSDKGDSTIDKEKIKNAIVEKVATFHLEKQPFIVVHIDDTASSVWSLARDNKETLIITSYFESSTEKIIAKVKQPVLVLKTHTENYKKIALVLDASSDAKLCIEDLKNHFNKSDITLFYDYRFIINPSMEGDFQSAQIIEDAQRDVFERVKKEHDLKGEFFIDGGLFDLEMNDYLETNAFELLYDCSQKDDFFISDSLALTLLNKVPCDMLVSSR